MVHLHNHTYYSVQDALASPTQLAMRCREMGFSAAAITDHGRMGGCVEFAEACKKPKDGLDPIKPILGCEFYVVPDRFDKSQIEREDGTKRRQKSFHLTLLAKNKAGYQNLLRMCSIGANPDCYHYEPRIDWEVLSQHSEGVIALTGCLGSEVNQALARGDEESAQRTMARYKDVFGEDYYGELQYHGIPLQKELMPKLKRLCNHMGMKMVASNDVHYVEKLDWEIHDKLIQMRDIQDDNLTKVNGKKQAYATHEFFLKDEQSMRKIFDGLQPDAVGNTLEVAEKVEDYFKTGVKHMLPKAKVPMEDQMFLGFWKKHYPYNEPAEAYLAYLAVTGLKALGLDKNPEYRKRLVYELKVIWYMGVVDYFLIQREFSEFMRKSGILFGIRGSGVASLVNYCIGVSDVDPIKWNLMFERFLNPGRGAQYETDFPGAPSKKWLESHPDEDNEAAMSELRDLVQKQLAANEEYKPHAVEMDKELYVLEHAKLGPYVKGLAESGFRSEKNEPQLWTAYFLGVTPEKPTTGLAVKAVATLPDVDTDIDDRYRDTAIEWMKRRFGEEHVAMIGAWGTYGVKAAVTACLKTSDKFRAKWGDSTHKMAQTISKCIVEQAKDAEDKRDPIEYACEQDPMFAKYVKEYPDEMAAARRLIGVVSHIGVHAAGVVVASEPICDHSPIEKSNKGLVTAYDMESVEKVGVVKYDLLGLAMYQKIQRALKLIKERHGKDVDLESIDFKDPRVFSLFNRGMTTTLFQFSSPGMQKALKDVKVSDVEDLIAVAALFRPGPLAFISDYAEGKRNPDSVVYPHPVIKKHLGVTYNIPVYQEQVMNVCKDLAGFDFLEVDIMRKAVSKKDMAGFQKACKLFREKCAKRGVDAKIVDDILASWQAFVGYAFNRAHSTSYALLAYKGAHLRTYYPVEWLASCIQADIGKKDRLANHRQECTSEKINVLRPDVNLSKMEVTISSKGSIVLPLTSIDGIGQNASNIVAEAPYESLKDFIVRSGANRSLIQALAESKCFRSLPDVNSDMATEDFMSMAEEYLKEREALKKAKKKLDNQKYVSMSPIQSKITQRPVRAAGKPFRPKPASSILDSFDD